MRERGSTRVLLSRDLTLLLILASGLTPSRAVESYIFTEEPLVRFSPDLGEPDLFGYAAALHRVDDTGSADDFDHAIMNTKYVHMSTVYVYVYMCNYMCLCVSLND